ncbi:hypothetical protein Tco_0517868 [Tanacetum coccineum]
MFWHTAKDDSMFTTIRVISKHQDTQLYGAILPQHLTNQAMLESEAYKTYCDYATGEKTLKTKSTKKKADSESSPKTKPTQASKGKIIKTSAKGDIPAKKNQSTTKSKGLTKSSDEEDDDEVNMGDDNDDDADNQDDDDQKHDGQDDEEQDDVNEQTDSDNDGDDFVHPKLSTHDEEDKEEEDSDPRVHTPSHVESTDDEDSDEEIQGQQQSSSVSSGFVSDMLYPSPNTSIDSIYNLNTDSTSLIDVPVTTIAEPSLLSATTLPPPPTPLITHLQQTPVPTLATVLKLLPTRSSQLWLFIRSDRLRDEAQAENKDLLNKLDDNIKKIIKDQVKEQVKAQVSKMLPKIVKTVNEQLEAEVFTEDQPDKETSQLPNWVSVKQQKPLLPIMIGNKTLYSIFYGPVQPWLSSLAQMEDPRESFNELMDTPLDFSAFVMNRLKVDTLTLELLAGPTFELMKGSCKSLINPEGQQYPHDLRKPLPLIPNSRGRRVIPFDHFINNDLAYLSGGVSSRTYTTSVTKTKAADYGHIKWIEDLVPNTMWSQVPVSYDKHALWGISHWGRKRQQFYGFAANRESARDAYSKRRIIALYKFKKGDFNRLRIQDIKDMLLLLVQGKLTNLTVEERLAFNVSLRMFIRSVVIQRRVEDLQLGVESYQKKLNLTKSDMYRSDLKRMEAYTTYSNPRGFIYQNKDKKNILMRIDKLHKFSDGTLNDVRTALNDRLKGIRMKYMP